MDGPLVEAFAEGCASAAVLIRHEVVATRWDEPSALDGYSVGGLTAHLMVATGRLADLLTEPEPDGARLVSAIEMFAPHRLPRPGRPDDGVHAWLVDTSHDLAAEGRDTIADRFDAAVAATLDLLAATDRARPVPIFSLPDSATTAADFLATRVLEVVVHGDDLAASVGVDWHPGDAAVAVAADLLLSLARHHTNDLGVVRSLARAERAERLRAL